MVTREGNQFNLRSVPYQLATGSNYLPFKWPSDFEYGLIFVDNGTIPSADTEVYTLQPSALASLLSMFYYEPYPVLIPRFPIPINSIALHGLAFFSLWWLFVCFQLKCEISATDQKSSSRAGDYGSEARLSALFPVRLVIPYLSSVLPNLHPAQSWPTLLACSGFNVQDQVSQRSEWCRI